MIPEFPEEETRPRMTAPCTGSRCRTNPSPPVVPLVRDPFCWEIYDEEVLVYLCEDCHQERADDI
jgi:hypothetical protein